MLFTHGKSIEQFEAQLDDLLDGAILPEVVTIRERLNVHQVVDEIVRQLLCELPIRRLIRLLVVNYIGEIRVDQLEGFLLELINRKI